MPKLNLTSSNGNGTLRQSAITCPGHTRPVVFLDFSAITSSGYYLITACKDGKPMLRQGETGDWIGTFEGHKGAVWGVALNSPATLAATAAADFQANVWDALSGAVKHSFAHKHIVKTVDFSSDDNLLVTGSNEKLLRIFDLNKPDSEPKMLIGHGGGIKQALFMPGDRQVLSIADDRLLLLWDVNTGHQIKKVELPANATSVEVSAEGQLLTITYGKKVSFWDVNKFEKVKEFTMKNEVYSASLHKDRKSFVSGGIDFVVYKHDYETGKEIESNKAHFGPVHCVRYSPDYELYASGSEDGTLRLWQNTIGKSYGLWKGLE